MTHGLLSLSILFLFVSANVGCAAETRAPQTATAGPAMGCDRDRDRKAILAMAGSYDVVFDFAETDVKTQGYEKHAPHKSYATELVIAIADTPGRVSLQHLLQLGAGKEAMIIKHWRQDWSFEDPELLEFQGNDTWQKRTLTSRGECTWNQAVYGVDDAPRYSGWGRWKHTSAGSEWSSNQTWRPLPRREYTTRKDYDVLVAINQHRITPKGWEHEQRNSKLVLEPRHVLVEEHGVNSYERGNPQDTAEAAAYWKATAPFWTEVRKEWEAVLAQSGPLELESEATGARLHEKLFELADRRSPVDEATRKLIHEVVGLYVVKAADKAR